MFSSQSQYSVTCHVYHIAFLRQGLPITTTSVKKVLIKREKGGGRGKKMNTKLLISTHIGIEMSNEGTQSAWLSNSCIKLSVYLGREIHSLSINVNRWTRTGIIAKCDLPGRRYWCRLGVFPWHGFLELWNLHHISEMSPFFFSDKKCSPLLNYPSSNFNYYIKP